MLFRISSPCLNSRTNCHIRINGLTNNSVLLAVYVDHITRIRAGGAILMISGGFYLPFSAALSNQIRRVPRLPYMIHQLQLASAAAGIWTFILPGVVLCIASFRPDRPVEITQALNDFFWIVALYVSTPPPPKEINPENLREALC